MILILSFLAEDYGIMPLFPSYRDSFKISISYYYPSRYPLISGCFKGFCVYAGTFKGFKKDSSFILRDHIKIIDTINATRGELQEVAILERYFGSGIITMGFHVGIIREIYFSSLISHNEIFPNNSLSLGRYLSGVILGGVFGLGFKNWFSYIMLRYRNFNRDSSLSNGDTTGWFITVPEGERNKTDILLNISDNENSIKVGYRDWFGLWYDRKFKVSIFNVKLGGGFYGKTPLIYGNLGIFYRSWNIIWGLGYYKNLYAGLGVSFSSI